MSTLWLANKFYFCPITKLEISKWNCYPKEKKTIERIEEKKRKREKEKNRREGKCLIACESMSKKEEGLGWVSLHKNMHGKKEGCNWIKVNLGLTKFYSA